MLNLTVLLSGDKDSLTDTCQPEQRASGAIPTGEWHSDGRSRTSVEYSLFLGIVQ